MHGRARYVSWRLGKAEQSRAEQSRAEQWYSNARLNTPNRLVWGRLRGAGGMLLSKSK